MHLYLTTFCCKSNKIVKIFAQGKLIWIWWIWLKLLQLFHKFNEFQYRISNLDEILFTARLYKISAFLHPWNRRGDSTPRILALGYDQSCYKICINVCCFWLLHHLNSAWQINKGHPRFIRTALHRFWLTNFSLFFAADVRG